MPEELPASTRRQIVNIWRHHLLYCLVFSSSVADIAARYSVKVEMMAMIFIIALFFAFAMTESFDFILAALFRQAIAPGLDEAPADPSGVPPKYVEAHGRRYLLLPETSKKNGEPHD
jgi:hypothetical protein